ncbi:MAG TPA: GNAT family N-acetyltransferase [Candidatus Babeliales bacterium]|nr:GNAT family N-acetyltransferase [Candidatus Babeliales bacterium]
MTYLRGKKWRWARWIGVFLIISGFAIIAFRYQSTLVLRPYSDTADQEYLTQSLEKDRFWITNDDEFSIERMLKERNPSRYSNHYHGKLQIKVLHEKGKRAGMVAYYKKSFYMGRVMILWVDPAFRGKGYGEYLLQYAINQLFKEGCTKVNLLTRLINTWSRKIYAKVGMHETSRDSMFIYYTIDKK